MQYRMSMYISHQVSRSSLNFSLIVPGKQSITQAPKEHIDEEGLYFLSFGAGRLDTD